MTFIWYIIHISPGLLAIAECGPKTLYTCIVTSGGEGVRFLGELAYGQQKMPAIASEYIFLGWIQHSVPPYFFSTNTSFGFSEVCPSDGETKMSHTNQIPRATECWQASMDLHSSMEPPNTRWRGRNMVLFFVGFHVNLHW